MWILCVKRFSSTFLYKKTDFRIFSTCVGCLPASQHIHYTYISRWPQLMSLISLNLDRHFFMPCPVFTYCTIMLLQKIGSDTWRMIFFAFWKMKLSIVLIYKETPTSSSKEQKFRKAFCPKKNFAASITCLDATHSKTHNRAHKGPPHLS